MSRGHHLVRKVCHRRMQMVAAMVAGALATAGIVAALASNDDEAPPQHAAGRPLESPTPVSPTPRLPTPAPAKSQSPATWVDTTLNRKEGPESLASWMYYDPLGPLRDAWSDVLAEHLEPSGGELDLWRQEWGRTPLDWREEVSGTFGILVDDGDGRLVGHGCRVIMRRWAEKRSGCRQHPLEGTHGKGAWVLQVPGRTVALVERARGTFGYVDADWHGGRDAPVPLDDLVAAAADPRLALPAKARAVPRNSTVAAVLHDHFPNLVPASVLPSELGIGEIEAPGPFPWLRIRVVPAGPVPPCGRAIPSYCIARQVYGAGDPTTVHLARSKGSIVSFVYVGRRHTVIVVSGIHANPHLQKRLIDLVLDPRLQ